jgi:hypothetical protein
MNDERKQDIDVNEITHIVIQGPEIYVFEGRKNQCIKTTDNVSNDALRLFTEKRIDFRIFFFKSTKLIIVSNKFVEVIKGKGKQRHVIVKLVGNQFDIPCDNKNEQKRVYNDVVKLFGTNRKLQLQD